MMTNLIFLHMSYSDRGVRETMNPSAAEFVPSTPPLTAAPPPYIEVSRDTGAPTPPYYITLPQQHVPRWFKGINGSPWRELRNSASNAFPAVLHIGGEPVGRCWAINAHLYVDGVAAAIYRHYCATNDWADFIVVFMFTRDYRWRLRIYSANAHRDSEADSLRMCTMYNGKTKRGGIVVMKHNGDIRELLTKPSEPPVAPPRPRAHMEEIVGSIMQMVDDD